MNVTVASSYLKMGCRFPLTKMVHQMDSPFYPLLLYGGIQMTVNGTKNGNEDAQGQQQWESTHVAGQFLRLLQLIGRMDCGAMTLLSRVLPVMYSIDFLGRSF
jgi:hypothetical protein